MATKRQKTLDAITYDAYVYNGWTADSLRWYVENRISYPVALKAVKRGLALRDRAIAAGTYGTTNIIPSVESI